MRDMWVGGDVQCPGVQTRQLYFIIVFHMCVFATPVTTSRDDVPDETCGTCHVGPVYARTWRIREQTIIPILSVMLLGALLPSLWRCGPTSSSYLSCAPGAFLSFIWTLPSSSASSCRRRSMHKLVARSWKRCHTETGKCEPGRVK